MKVTKLLKDNNKNKIAVYIDDDYYFWLTQKEIDKLELEEDAEISYGRITSIIDNIVFKKAKSKAMNLLKYCDRTEYEIKNKLAQNGYIDSVIENVIFFLKEYNYVDDYKYACNYVNYHQNKSILQLKGLLLKKGIDKTLIHEALEHMEVKEEDIIHNIIVKKSRNYDFNKREDVQKMYYHLIRKGFNAPTVINKINQYKS
ncbi:regulatory protein [Natranaerovirga hydrolytica]|uniref:Regulatory protein RecX n=1 Tax=Natranaerovirga hydrolytica TaxID=680378 RepID=A0A4R1MZC3_9FIRM|nr:regulatory protein RecX [Natranaerovirga hydrolytica]TCK97960.1 regulatory protein [Natranaerovirga hydrolytica]